MKDTHLIAELTENGRSLFDLLTSNCRWVSETATEAELLAQIKVEAEIFGTTPTVEERRAEARETLADLLRKGRGRFAREHCETQIKNLAI